MLHTSKDKCMNILVGQAYGKWQITEQAPNIAVEWAVAPPLYREAQTSRSKFESESLTSSVLSSVPGRILPLIRPWALPSRSFRLRCRSHHLMIRLQKTWTTATQLEGHTPHHRFHVRKDFKIILWQINQAPPPPKKRRLYRRNWVLWANNLYTLNWTIKETSTRGNQTDSKSTTSGMKRITKIGVGWPEIGPDGDVLLTPCSLRNNGNWWWWWW
jgi:hypothetical protein